jgi:hypothetical protein
MSKNNEPLRLDRELKLRVPRRAAHRMQFQCTSASDGTSAGHAGRRLSNRATDRTGLSIWWLWNGVNSCA